MQLVKRERKFGDSTGGPGGISDISDYDIVDSDEVIAECWEMRCTSMRKAFEECGDLSATEPDERIKILMSLTCVQISELERCVKKWISNAAKIKEAVEEKKVCDVCGEEIFNHVGVRLDFTTDENSNDVIKLKETFGKTDFNICLRCWVLSMGVKQG